ncbi:Hypothetical protein GLP15_1764 [Giardia lamblia P15]|uniref:Uncharacterized protein n=1 Tax=Giardia intestinalis (strain P15) TaxID=658858 RepID=E1F792_GIAIA|nr:Hypothetical protein GLP15_1764 [Giardia lamblia P15]
MYSLGLPNLPHTYKSDRQRLFVEEDRAYVTLRDEKSHCLLLSLREKGIYQYVPILVSTSQYILVEDEVEYADEIKCNLTSSTLKSANSIQAIVVDDPAYSSFAANPTEKPNSALQEKFAKSITYHAVYSINSTNLILILYSCLSLDVQFYHIILKKKLVIKEYTRILPNAVSVSAIVETMKVDNQIFIGAYDRLYSLTFPRLKGRELHMFIEPPEINLVLFGRLISGYKLSINFIPANAVVGQLNEEDCRSAPPKESPQKNRHSGVRGDVLNCDVERLPTPSESAMLASCQHQDNYNPVTLISTNNVATMDLADFDVVPDTLGAEEIRAALQGGDEGGLHRFPSKADTVITPFNTKDAEHGTNVHLNNADLPTHAVACSSYNDEVNVYMRNQIQNMVSASTACVVLIGGVVRANGRKYDNKRVIYIPIDNMSSWVYQTLGESKAIWQDWDISFLEREKMIAFGGRRRRLSSDLRVIDLSKGTVYVCSPLHGCLVTPRRKASIFLFYDKGVRKLRIESGCTRTEVLRDVAELILPM